MSITTTNLYPTLLYISYGEVILGSGYAIFDLDDTIIKTKSHKKFPIDSDDWTFFNDNVIEKLKDLNTKGYSLFIISNQAGISKRKVNKSDIIEKIEKILIEINLPVGVYISEDIDYWRKPNTSIFEHYMFDKNLRTILYVGDAAGRKNDFSDTDRKFSYNLDLFLRMKNMDTEVKFKTPEEFFDNKPQSSWKYSGITPENYVSCEKFVMSIKENNMIYQMMMQKLNASPREKFVMSIKENHMIIMVGAPGSGKSHIAKEMNDILPDSIIISQDKYKTKAATIKAAKNAKNKNIIIDNTNPSEESRRIWIDIAQDKNLVPIIIYVFTSIELSKHMNVMRERIIGQHNILNEEELEYKRVPEIAYRIYNKKFEYPENSIEIHPSLCFNTSYERTMFEQLS